MSTKRFFQLASLGLLFATPSARAQWQVDGVVLCSDNLTAQLVPLSVSDGQGGAIVTWRDDGVDFDIYAQRVDAAGNVLWTASGVAICIAVGAQLAPCIAPDGAGGAIIAWHDGRSGLNYDIYAQRIDAAGNVLWTPDGVPICMAADRQILPTIIADGNGGAIIAWDDQRDGTHRDIYARRIDASGNAVWNVDGIAICTAPGDQATPKIAPDNTGGAVITWTDVRSGTNYDLYAQRVNASGGVLWASDGVAVCTAWGDQNAYAIAADGASGGIVVWRDDRSADRDIYAQRVDASGNALWMADGLPLCNAVGHQEFPSVVADGSGGVIVTWDDQRAGVANRDIYAQRTDAGGNMLWATNGVAVCAAGLHQSFPVVVSDGAGGGMFAWRDNRGTFFDVYAQRIDAAGNATWIADGIAICSAPESQQNVAAVPDGSGGAIVAWADARNGYWRIFAQHANGNGQLGQPVSFVVTTVADTNTPWTLRYAIEQANATTGHQTIRFQIPGVGPHMITPLSFLPVVTDELTIDGFTQTGSSPNTRPVGTWSNAQVKINLYGPFSGSPDGLVFQAPGTVRGISTHGWAGAAIRVSSPGVVIEGNYIGMDASGITGIGNQTGVLIEADGCVLGGALPASRNVIGWNDSGVRANGADGVQIYGNFIGIGADASTDAGNYNVGILLENDAQDARIGSSVLDTSLNPEEANMIWFNGVVLQGSGTIRNAILGNSLQNTWPSPSIDIDGDGLTFNDFQDADTGPNQRQNYPELLSASGTQITGHALGTPFQYLMIHFYRSSECQNGTAHVWFGATTAVMDENGVAPLTYFPSQPIPAASLITAIATDALGNTSEVSGCVLSQNTPAGSSTPVPLVDQNGTPRGTATYEQVDASGNTFLAWSVLPPVLLSGGFFAGDPSDADIYFDVTTNATFQGYVDVCLSYDENNIPGPESDLQLVHYNGSYWEAVTTSRDEVNNTVCGRVTTLSPFVIAVSTATAIEDRPLPNQFALHTNVPNPFNPQTTIHYDVPASGADVNISIYDVAGRLVRELANEQRAAGRWSVQWNGDDDRSQRVASGVYFYRMRAGSFVDTKKMVLLK